MRPDSIVYYWAIAFVVGSIFLIVLILLWIGAITKGKKDQRENMEQST